LVLGLKLANSRQAIRGIRAKLSTVDDIWSWEFPDTRVECYPLARMGRRSPRPQAAMNLPST